MYVCVCRGITDGQIHAAINSGCDDYTKIRNKLQVGMQCGKCACYVKQMVNAVFVNAMQHSKKISRP